MSLIFPKKEILYAPMLGTLGGGSSRGFGQRGGKKLFYLTANAPRVFMGHNTAAGIQVQDMDTGNLIRTISYNSDNFDFAHMGYQTFDYYTKHSTYGASRYDEAGAGAVFQRLQQSTWNGAGKIQTNRAETEIFAMSTSTGSLLGIPPNGTGNSQYGIPASWNQGAPRAFFIDQDDDKYYQDTSQRIVRFTGAGGSNTGTYYSPAYASDCTDIIVPWTDPTCVLALYQNGELRCYERNNMSSLRWERGTGWNGVNGIITTHPDGNFVVWSTQGQVSVINTSGQRIAGPHTSYGSQGPSSTSNIYNVFSDYDGLFIFHDNAYQYGFTLDSNTNNYYPTEQWSTQRSYNISSMAGACPWSEQNKLFDATA